MRMIAPLLALAPLTACATATTSVGEPPMAGNGACSAEGLQSAIGQRATATLGADLLAKSGARTLRWGPPRSAMTMDYREDRLNISYDDAMMIERVNCG
ncbi:MULTISPECIES: I78 family peptidase inhibitor [unclassified Sphingobium]|uniref:I78 family peptidase inhibitor n=1 Tax=unclassified Sphingobium TaxID=2611147 RepID=UPI002224610F|nr:MULTISPECIES: I78 family peptidase inhibitor [unclassified Sphingobium]MCW2381564.1 hypothetical protein [Sphingobium sp. B2D3B]MCW2398329.1 hypothetical protein [Sphingobium sp. B2D3C]